MHSTSTVKELREEAMNLIEPPQFVLLREDCLVKLYRAALPMGHQLECEPFTFLNEMIPRTTALIEEELNRLGGLKFTPTLVVELEYIDITDNNNNVNKK